MAKTCDLCGSKTGFRSFRCIDGIVCKKCYAIVSNHFTTTITDRTLDDLRKIYDKNSAPLDLGEDGFQITRKIGTALLLDETKKKFCIPSNRNITKNYSRPEIFSYAQLAGCKLYTEPSMEPEELAALSADRQSDVVVKHMGVLLRLKEGRTLEITVIPSAVRASSYAFRKSYRIAMDLLRELNAICIED